MSILLNPWSDGERWHAEFARLLPDLRIQRHPDVDDVEAVRYLIAWKHDLDELGRYRNLSAILSLGAGVDQFMDPRVPDVPIVRLADPAMATEMAAYAFHWVSHFHRRHDAYLAQQSNSNWTSHDQPPTSEFTVGILGYGTIGRRIGEAFAHFGHPVSAWSRSGGPDTDPVRHFAGQDQLGAFVDSCDAIVDVLPNTTSTAGLVDRSVFSQMRPGSIFVNVGRGATVVEDDLLATLDDGHLHAAVLDVTSVEPLPAESRLWTHPSVRITPHISGETRLETAAALIAANITRLEAGEQPFPIADRQNGY